jgi:AcrR family transcriptional regulator
LIKGNSLAEKNKILNYAKSRFLKDGFYKTSMDIIASELHISKKTIYKHFPAKERLVEEMTFIIMSTVSAKVDEILNMNKNALLKISKLTELLGDTIVQFSENWIRDIRNHMPALWEKIDSFRTKKMNAGFSQLIEQGKKEKLFTDKPNEIILTMFIASIRAIVNPDFLYYNKFSYKEAVQITMEILFNGILTEKGKKLFYKSFPPMRDK